MFKNSVDNIAFFKGTLLRVPLVRVLRKLRTNSSAHYCYDKVHIPTASRKDHQLILE